MCAERGVAQTKIDHLIVAIDRLTFWVETMAKQGQAPMPSGRLVKRSSPPPTD